MSILDHVKYKHPNKSLRVNTNSVNMGQQKRIAITKKANVQDTGKDTQMVSQRPSIPEIKSKTGNDRQALPTKKPRAIRGADPNKNIKQRANKQIQHKLKSFGELKDLFQFPEESVSCDPLKTE